MTYRCVRMRHVESARRPVRRESEPCRRSSGIWPRCARRDAETRQASWSIRASIAPLRGGGSRLWPSRRSAALHCLHDSGSRGAHRALERTREAEWSHAQLDRRSGRRRVPGQNGHGPAWGPWAISQSNSNTRLTAWPICCSARPTASLSLNIAR